MGAQSLVATRPVDASIVIEVAERGREAVGTMFDGHPAERPKCVLQANGKRGETFAGVAPARHVPSRVSQHEVIQPMVQRLAGVADAGIGHVGEIRQRLLSRHMVLTEDDVTIGAVFGAPGTNADAPGSDAALIPARSGVTALHLLDAAQPVASRDV